MSQRDRKPHQEGLQSGPGDTDDDGGGGGSSGGSGRGRGVSETASIPGRRSFYLEQEARREEEQEENDEPIGNQVGRI